MATCDYCGTTILFGGVRDDNMRFCNKECHKKGAASALLQEVSQDVVDKEMNDIHQGLCPKCQGNGPVDVHTSYRIYSFLLFTSWKSIPTICCRSCGIKRQIGSGMLSFIFGWWGFPWGLMLTPVQIVRNIVGTFRGPDVKGPSKKLEDLVRIGIVQDQIEERQGTFT